jgi:hypothetical protein
LKGRANILVLGKKYYRSYWGFTSWHDNSAEYTLLLYIFYQQGKQFAKKGFETSERVAYLFVFQQQII